MRQVSIPAGKKHNHDGVEYYGPCTILMSEEDAARLSELVVNSRIETREEALNHPDSPESMAANSPNSPDSPEAAETAPNDF